MARLHSIDEVLAARKGDTVSIPEMRRWVEQGAFRFTFEKAGRQLAILGDFGEGRFELRSVSPPSLLIAEVPLYKWICVEAVPTLADIEQKHKCQKPEEKRGDCCASCCSCSCHRT